MSKYRCIHDEFSIINFKKYSYHIYYDRLVDDDNFPGMKNGYCTEECKEKMKEIYKISMEEFSKNIQNYYEDARIFQYGENDMDVDLYSYESFLKKEKICEKTLDEYDREVIACFKVGILNGKPVRLCDLPEGVKYDFDADNLPECPVEKDEE